MQKVKQLLSSIPLQLRKPRFGLSPFALTVTIFGIIKLVLHLLTARNGGYYCDELYSIDMSKHLALGYVDLPPLVPALVALTRLLLGESLLAIHLVPALAGVGTLVFICLVTRELGGRLFATILSATCALINVFWLCASTYFGYDSFDQLMLSIFLFVLVRFLKTGNRKLWIGLGLAAGFSFLAKATILYYGPGFLVALLATRHRRDLITRWPWIGLGVFLVVASPYIGWQIANGWPTLEFWGNYHARLYPANVVEYFSAIVVTFNPVVMPLVAAGLYRIFRRFEGISFAFLGVLFATSTVFLFELHARYHLLFALFGPLIAAGSVFLEQGLLRARWKTWIQAASIAAIAIAGMTALPSALSILPPQEMRQYGDVFGFYWKVVKFDSGPPTPLPLIYGYRNGWEDLVKTVAQAYNSLPPEDRAKCGGIITDWFGPAGAVDLLGPKYGLPRAVSGHMNYYLWGPGETSWEVMIAATWNNQLLTSLFGYVLKVGTVQFKNGGPGINGLPVYVCKSPYRPVDEVWPMFKAFN